MFIKIYGLIADQCDSVGGVIALAAVIVIILEALSFFVTAGTLWLICHLLGMTWWSWKIAAAIWLCMQLVSAAVKPHIQNS